MEPGEEELALGLGENFLARADSSGAFFFVVFFSKGLGFSRFRGFRV